MCSSVIGLGERMKIIKVIVDEMPLSASGCAFSSSVWNPAMRLEVVKCEITGACLAMYYEEFIEKRCENCLLEFIPGRI